MKRHAYMILAHHEFELLQLLLTTLDDERNDIFLHIDSKVPTERIPLFHVAKAGFSLLDQRVDVRWGDLSVVEAEYALFEAVAASSSRYAYCHLLSGVDLPLKSQSYIHAFFERHTGQEFVGFYNGDDLSPSIDRKVRRYHLFPRSFRGKGILFQLRRLVRALALRAQIVLGLRRHRDMTFQKGTQWISITHTFLDYLLEQKKEIMSLYRYTFCPDEIFVQTALWHSPYRDKIYDLDNEARGCMRCIGWSNNLLRDFAKVDLPRLLTSDALWARKFNLRDRELIDSVLRLCTNTFDANR